MKVFTRALAVLGLVLLGGVVVAAPPEKVKLDIRQQPIRTALAAFSNQSGIQIVYPDDEVTPELTSPTLVGKYAPQVALDRLLADTGLRYQYVNDRTVAIRRDTSSDDKNDSEVTERPLGAAPSHPRETQEVASQQTTRAEGATHSTRGIEEVVVTAQKREENLQDVPVPVTAVSAASLVEHNQLSLQDYYTKIPGLNLTMLGDVGNAYISIRGITTGGYINPTVGFVVDDVPFGTSTAAVAGLQGQAPDIDPTELTRVEVLRGPQGTLYGASSMGGLVKYVTADPSTDQVNGRLQIGTTKVRDGQDLGYSVRGAANVPLSDTFAIRASGSSRGDPGYIDNLQAGKKDVNSGSAQTARLAALWEPSEHFSLRLSALYQRAQRDGSSDTHLPAPVGPVAGLGDLEQSALVNTGTYDNRYQAYSAILTGKTGSAELTSLTGYGTSEFATSLDAAPIAGFAQTNFGVRGAASIVHGKVSKFSQELRLAMPLGERVQWLVGAFYTHENYPGSQDVLAIDPATGAVAGTFNNAVYSGNYSEYAGFTDLTFQVTDRFDIQIGGRHGHNRITSAQSNVATPTTPQLFVTSVTPEFRSTDDAFTYLVTPRFRINPDVMAYARVASGYRPGGVNTFTVGTIIGVPTEFGHDTTKNYEIGIKGRAFGRLSYDTSVYYIDWSAVQLQLRTQVPSGLFQAYTLNVGGAKSEGAELSVEFRPIDSLRVTSWVAFNHALLTDVPQDSPLVVFKDSRLPYSARWSGNLSVDKAFRLGTNVTASAEASLSYVGDRKGRFFTSCVGATCTGFPQENFRSYTQLDLRAEATFSSWTISAFINNVTDERGVLRRGRDASLSLLYAVSYTQPRTIGLSLARSF